MKFDKNVFWATGETAIGGSWRTQSLFLEIMYKHDMAVFTLQEEDRPYKGKTYISLKKLYMEMEDVTEYMFATTYLGGWEHWQAILGNEALLGHISCWRNELELKLRARAIKQMMLLATGGTFAAAKWMSDGSWNQQRGRPSKAEMEKRRKVLSIVAKETEQDSDRVIQFVKKGAA